MSKSKQRYFSHSLVSITGIFLLSLYLYYPSLKGFFFQDDWFTVSISRVKTLSDYFYFFQPRTDVIYYRPLGMQVYFSLLLKLFGLQSLPFHLTAFLTHLINIILVWKLTHDLTTDIKTSTITSFFYGTASFHFIPFYWASTFPFILGPLFFFSAFYIYSFYRNKNIWLMSYLIFILGLLTNEVLITFPLILVLYELLFYKKSFKIMNTVVYFLLLIPYLLIRFYIGSVPFSESYKPEITHIIPTLRSYLLWVANWPEEISNQFVSAFSINQNFIKDFSLLVSVLSVLLVFLLILNITAAVQIFLRWYTIHNRPEGQKIRVVIFGLLWFAISLAPSLFFPKHAFPYYLGVPSFGFFVALGTLIAIFKMKMLPSWTLIIIVSILWFLGSWVSTSFSTQTHWASKRSRITSVVLGELKKKYPAIPSKTVVMFPRDSLLKITLNDQRALQILYNDPTIKTIYSEGKDEDREKFVPKNDQELVERFPFTVVLGGKGE